MKLLSQLSLLALASAPSALAAVQPIATAITANPSVITLNPSVTKIVTRSLSTKSTASSSYNSTSSTTVSTTTPISTKPTSTSSTSTSVKPNPTDPSVHPQRNANGEYLRWCVSFCKLQWQFLIALDIKGFYNLPNGGDVIKNATLNATNIQGDILVGMRKKLEVFYFFSINNVTSFKYKLHTQVVPTITNTQQLLSVSSQPIVALNLAFSQSGFNTLGITANINDSPFSAGQTADANNLGDPGTKNWVKAFIGTKIHGVFLIASDKQVFLDAEISVLETLFGTDITKVYSLQGNIRPPPFEGHEMFGFLDGVGQPAVAGFNLSPVPGQQVISPGVILTGEPGDTLIGSRPSWAKDGSFLVFRQLKQLVPEFNKFLWDNAPPVSGFTQAQSADLLGARMIGRWKSGAPIDLAPTVDDPVLAADPLQNNNFDFFHTGFSPSSDESHCPFSAHIRKSRPRSDQPSPLNAILRSGIPYGPELTSAEAAQNVSSTSADLERGLAFVSYQSQIGLGFQFIQEQWANNPGFPFGKIHNPGFDPIFGQNNGATRFMNGYDIDDTTKTLNLPFEFVVSRGGEYFYSPSIEALANVFSV